MPLPDCAFVDSGEGGANTLGMSFLTRFNITFDFPKGFLYLKPRRNMNRPDRRNLSGLVASRPADEPLVHFVVPNSAAAKAGLEAKDVMVRINQKDARRLTCYEIEFELSESGATMPLTVRRGSRLIDVKITLPTITPPKRVAVDTSKKKFLPDNE